MTKRMQKRVLKVMGIWKAKDRVSESERWLWGKDRTKRKELRKWIR